MAVMNIGTISSGMAKRIDRGSGALNERVERLKDSSVGMGRQATQAASMAEAGTLRQTETYQGYSKTLRPAMTVAQTGAAVMATMSAVQLTRDYKRFNKEHGEEIQKFLDGLKEKGKPGAVIANVEGKTRTVRKDEYKDVLVMDINGNLVKRQEVITTKSRQTFEQKPVVVGDWNKRSLFRSQMNSHIDIATKHSRAKLSNDGARHGYRHNPLKARKQAKRFEKELTRRAVVRNVDSDNVKGGWLSSYKARRAMKSELKLNADLEKTKIKNSSKVESLERKYAKASISHDKREAIRGKLFKNQVPRGYDNTRASERMKSRILRKEDIVKNSGKKVKGVTKGKNVDLKDGDLLLQATGKKAMAAKGAKAFARRKRLNSLRKGHMSLIRSTGVTRNNDFGEGYQIMQKGAIVAKPFVRRIALQTIKRMLRQSGKIAKGVVGRVGVEALATGIHARRVYMARKGGRLPTPPVNVKTAKAMFKKDHGLAKDRATGLITGTEKRAKGAINGIKTRAKEGVKKVALKMTAPFRNFIINSLNKIKGTAFGKGVGAFGRVAGKVLGGLGRALVFPLKPFLALFRGLAAVFSTISSFIFTLVFTYALIFGLIMASGSILSGVFGIFDSVATAVSEAWENTDPNVKYAVDEIQDASKELSDVTKMQENVAVIASLVELPISQFWHKLTKKETEVCAGYDIVLIGETEHAVLEIPAAGDTVNTYTIDIKKTWKNGKEMFQENDREILSVVSNLYESYGGISNTFNIGKQIEKAQWKNLVQQLYILSHSTNMREESFTLDNYSINYWTGETTVTSSSTYYKWVIEVEILRGTDFFNECGQIALNAGKKIDPDIEVTTEEELLEWYVSSMEKEELWDPDSNIAYNDYEYTYFDSSDGILAKIAKHFKSTPQSQSTYEYSNPPDNVFIVDSDDDNNSFEYVRVLESEDGTYSTTGVTFKVSDGSLSVGSVFASTEDGTPGKKEQEYIDKYLEENEKENE